MYGIDRADSTIFVFAGNGSQTSPLCRPGLGDGGIATQGCLAAPGALAVGRAANTLYIADVDHRKVRFVDELGLISTVAGNGEFAFSWDTAYDGGLAIKAPLGRPSGLAVHPTSGILIISGYDTKGTNATGQRELVRCRLFGASRC